MSDIDELRATVEQLKARVRVARGPGRAQATGRALRAVGRQRPAGGHRRAVDRGRRLRRGRRHWDAGARRHHQHGERDGHQRLISNGCGHVLTVPHIAVDGDQARGAITRSTSAGTPSGIASGWPASRQIPGGGCGPPPDGASPNGSTPLSTAHPNTASAHTAHPETTGELIRTAVNIPSPQLTAASSRSGTRYRRWCGTRPPGLPRGEEIYTDQSLIPECRLDKFDRSSIQLQRTT